MSFIEEFVKLALTAEQPFMMKKNNNYVSLFYDKVGKAKYIFARIDYRSNDIFELSTLSLNPKLVAIVANDIVYIIDSYFFDIYPGTGNIPIISHMTLFTEVCKNAQQQIDEEIFPALFENLVVTKELNKEKLAECRRRAREALLEGTELPYNECYIRLSQSEVAKVLCGFTTVKEFAESAFQKVFDEYMQRKACLQAAQRFMDSSDIAKDWELKMAKSLNSIDAKNVTVEFSLNGKTGSAKMEPWKIIQALIDADYFCDFNFATKKNGAELIANLGAANSRFDKTEKQVLTCEQIVKISYKNKVLFER